MITLADRIEKRRLAREALAKVVAKSLFEEWLKENAHLIPDGASEKQTADAAFADPAVMRVVLP